MNITQSSIFTDRICPIKKNNYLNRDLVYMQGRCNHQQPRATFGRTSIRYKFDHLVTPR